VALGAAVQAGVLPGEVKDILLLDVTPLSLGIETLGGVSTVLIPRNTTIPTRKTETFSTASDNQTSVEVHVLQGERPMARDNRTLGKFHLDGIPPAPRGVPQVEVTFDIDANGIVNVTAKDKATNKEQHITITASSGLNEAEIKRMVEQAQQHEAEDKKRREAIEARNQLDSLAYNTQKLVDDNRDKLPEAERLAVEEELKSAKDLLERHKEAVEPEPLRAGLEQLQKAAHKLAEAMYRSAGPSAGAGGDGGGGAGAGPAGAGEDRTQANKDVIDAEFEETK
jgi:molecular chaperone DnaK